MSKCPRHLIEMVWLDRLKQIMLRRFIFEFDGKKS